CNARATYRVATIDLLALDRTRLCTMSLPDPTTQPLVFAGDIRPQNLGASFDRMVWESGASAMAPDAQGKATIESYAGAARPRPTRAACSSSTRRATPWASRSRPPDRSSATSSLRTTPRRRRCSQCCPSRSRRDEDALRRILGGVLDGGLAADDKPHADHE